MSIWRLTFGKNNRPFLLKRIESGKGVTDEPAPGDLLAYIEDRWGPFDHSGGFGPNEFSGLPHLDIDWPLPQADLSR